MRQITILGAGQSAGYLIDQLLKESQEQDWFVTVCDRHVDAAERAIGGHERGQAVAFDVNDATARSAMVGRSDVVVNLLTRPYQHLVALECLQAAKHMITASFEEPRVREMDADAIRRNILILNEMGLDPGIDHMIAMSAIERVREEGGIITAFRSYGSGLPAPEVETNPLRYAITWNPRNVIMAGEDGAIYKESGSIKVLPFHQIFQRTWSVDIDGLGSFEAYPNRDSLEYVQTLGLKKAHTIIHGTLRYPGWAETWQQIVFLGLNNEVLRIPGLGSMTYRQFTEMFLPPATSGGTIEQQVANHLGISPTGRIMQNLKWLGLFSRDRIVGEPETAAAVMLDLIRTKLRLPDKGRDFVILYHDLEVEYPKQKGRKVRIIEKMVEYGDPKGFTAIARTVGMPLAASVKLLLNGRLAVTGCRIPTHPAIYKPVLEELFRQGLVIGETITDIAS